MDGVGAVGAPVEGCDLAGWGVLPGGEHIGLTFRAADGATRRIVLPFDALSSLLMTLPRMLQSALDARFPDGSLRVVQQLARWKLEQKAADDGLILSLETRDGFEVAFSVSPQDADSLGARLRSAPRQGDTDTAAKPN
jgi:hypothetical protein